MLNSDWEYLNQEKLEGLYLEKISGRKPNLAVRKIICQGCGRVFYTQIDRKKYCHYDLCGNRGYQKQLKQRREAARQNLVCPVCGKTFSVKRSDAKYCSNACRQKAYRQRVTENQGVIKST